MVPIPRVLALGRESQKELLTAAQPAGRESGQHHFFGGAGVGRRFEDHELTRAQATRDRLHGALDIAQVGLAAIAKGRRHADGDGVGLVETAEIGGGLEASGIDSRGQASAVDMTDVGAPLEQRRDLRRVGVEPEHAEADVGERQ